MWRVQTIVGTLYLWWQLMGHNHLWCHESTTISLWGHKSRFWTTYSLHHNIWQNDCFLYYGIKPVHTTKTCNINVITKLTMIVSPSFSFGGEHPWDGSGCPRCVAPGSGVKNERAGGVVSAHSGGWGSTSVRWKWASRWTISIVVAWSPHIGNGAPVSMLKNGAGGDECSHLWL